MQVAGRETFLAESSLYETAADLRERSEILEFDGRLSRAEAERRAGLHYRRLRSACEPCRLLPESAPGNLPADAGEGKCMARGRSKNRRKEKSSNKTRDGGGDTPWRPAGTNLAIRGLDVQIGQGGFHNNRQPDPKTDFILAKRGFDICDWRVERVRDHNRCQHGAPPAGRRRSNPLQAECQSAA